MKSKNWFWGLFFVITAAFIVAGQVVSFGEIGVFHILATAVLAALMIMSLFKLNYFGIFVPAALLYILFWKPLGLVFIAPWILILSGVLASIGFSVLFHKHSKKQCHKWSNGKENFNATSESIDDNNPHAKINFGSSIKYIHADNLQKGEFSVSFGSLEVFFDQAKLSPEGAEIFLECSFGSIKLFVPKNWKVVSKLHTNLGGVENDIRLSKPDENSPQLTISGNVQLGGIEITYI
ncbi:MAG: hypothetical protein WC677_06310 [Clostridia bacterium]|jgi:predicted membrane protein